MTSFRKTFDDYTSMVEDGLSRFFPHEEAPYKKVREAMLYSLLAGGKRLRPIILLEFYRVFGGNPTAVLHFACALEMIHTYSLIHDDLPCMDDDDLRRGRPTNHKVYGEGMALLAGDGLLNTAFELMINPVYNASLDAENVLRAAHEIGTHSGVGGMIGGQTIDIERSGSELCEDELEQICMLKTAALFKAAARAGAILAGAGDDGVEAADKYAASLGLGFQIRDDTLDAEGDPDEMGKNAGRDARQNKSTFYTVLGAEECKKRVARLSDDACCAISAVEDNEFLKWLAARLCSRMT